MKLDGIYKTQSGAIYKIAEDQKNNYKFLYWEPNQRQINSGIKKGDTAFEGNLISNILSGVFYQYYSLRIKELCPKHWENPTNILLTISDDEKKIEGDLLEERIQDNCVKDARRITKLIFERMS